MKNLVVLASLLVPSLAVAQPYDAAQTRVEKEAGVAAFSLSVGAAEYMHGGLSLDGSKRLGDTPVFAHAQIDAGRTSELFGTERGNYLGAHGGLELRGCVGDPQLLCAYMGLDAGVLHETLDRMSESDEAATRFTFGPRAGIEFGNKTRVRLGFDSAVAPSETGPLEMSALQLTAGLVTAF